jgi:hypothetical protein
MQPTTILNLKYSPIINRKQCVKFKMASMGKVVLFAISLFVIFVQIMAGYVQKLKNHTDYHFYFIAF